jgi:CDP-diacylglycerol--glycerol-3-phosphate 3-phosphatidyltransferase
VTDWKACRNGEIAGGVDLVNIPNILTMLRVALIPVLVMLAYLPYDWRFPEWCRRWFSCWRPLPTGLMAIWRAGWNQSTAFGRFLDPVADKLMVAAALVILVQWHHDRVLVVISAIVIMSREITISALREWMAELGKRASVAVSSMGKWKTTADDGHYRACCCVRP